MHSQAELAQHFDRARGRLRAVAYRMLGSAEEAEDAVQDTWLRAVRGDTGEVVNMTAWLTTIVGRVCLDTLRSRSRNERATDAPELERAAAPDEAAGPEEEAVLADSVGLALLVVLDRLGPAERIAFVLHDLFAVPFDDIARIVDRSTPATKKLASRARHRVRGTPRPPAAEPAGHRAVVEAFLAASRAGDLDALLAVLAPDVVRRADLPALRPGASAELRGARGVATETAGNADRARFARVALVDGEVGAVVAPRGRLRLVLRLATDGERVTAIEVVADPERLRTLPLAVLDVPAARAV